MDAETVDIIDNLEHRDARTIKERNQKDTGLTAIVIESEELDTPSLMPL